MLISAFRGWNDGGQGASLAGGFLARAWAREQFATIDPELFFDFQATRPQSRSSTATTRRIDWPENAFLHAPLPGGGRDAVLLLGVEPNLRWRTFSELVTGLATRARRRARRHARLAARRRPAHAARAGDRQRDRPGPDRAARASRPRATRARPGIVGVAARRLPPRRVPVGEPLGGGAALRLADAVARAPPRRSCDRLGTLLDADSTRPSSRRRATPYTQQVSEAVAADEETAAYVEELERRVDEIDDETDLPSGDALAAELTRFLREREKDGGDDVAARAVALALAEGERVGLDAGREAQLEQRRRGVPRRRSV